MENKKQRPFIRLLAVTSKEIGITTAIKADIIETSNNASVAQLDRAMVFETIGRRFESCQTHQI